VLKTPTGEIHGSLEVPKGAGPFHVVVFIAGSGPTDRDGNQAMSKNDSLKKLGTALVSRGFATLRYDKRGTGKSNGVRTKEATMSLDHFVTDAVGWVQMLRKDKRFANVSILGHSQGSLVGAIASRRAKVATMISVAGAGLPIQEVLRMQLDGKLPDELKTQAFDIISKLAKGQSVPKPPAALQSLFRPSVQPFLSSWMKYDPQAEFAALQIPILVVNGTTDIQVGVDQAKQLQSASKQAQLVVLKNMNHVLTTCTQPEDQLATYSDPKRPLAPKLVDSINQFLKSAVQK
ncbi:MAG: alpha/beta hydrolase, partial [Planctomycetaceae bacterium]